MAHSNRGRVVLGGLLAGLVINIIEYVTNGLILKDAWASVMQSLNRPTQITGGEILMFNVVGFVLGIAAVWIYAGIRPRYGAGPATAVRAGLVVWAIGALLPGINNYIVGLVPARLLLVPAIVALIEIPVATVIGASIYKEESAASVVQRAAA